MSNPLGAFEWKLEVVMVRPFSLFLLHNHFITDFFFKKNPAKHNTKYKDSAIFAFYFLLHKRANSPLTLSLRPSLRPSLEPLGSIKPLVLTSAYSLCAPPKAANVAKLIRQRRISLKRDNHPQNPSVKSI
jgi:hypothetical protein